MSGQKFRCLKGRSEADVQNFGNGSDPEIGFLPETRHWRDRQQADPDKGCSRWEADFEGREWAVPAGRPKCKASRVLPR